MEKIKTNLYNTNIRYRLESMPHAQTHILIKGDINGGLDEISLYSYSTRVITIEYNNELSNYTVEITGTYSPTTTRHINRFTTELTTKNLYHELKNKEFNKPFPIDELNINIAYIKGFVYRYDNYGKRFYGNY